MFGLTLLIVSNGLVDYLFYFSVVGSRNSDGYALIFS